MRKIKFNVVKAKNIGTGVETDIPAIKGEGINYDEEINQLADEIERLNDVAEHKANKTDAITEETESSTENYPSNKAMTDYVAEHGGTGAVSDVQINGTSILTDGVANIPVAGDNLGVVKLLNTELYGLKLASFANPYLMIAPSTLDLYKIGNYPYKAVTIINQHASTFYGLAKASGTDEKNSTLPLGQYTEEAKASIQRMIGIVTLTQEEYDLIEVKSESTIYVIVG